MKLPNSSTRQKVKVVHFYQLAIPLRKDSGKKEQLDPVTSSLLTRPTILFGNNIDFLVTKNIYFSLYSLINQSRDSGVWTETMLPVSEIFPKSSIIYGCQSRGIMTGCTECTLEYRSSCGKAAFTIYSSNPYVGGKHAGAKSATKVTVATSVAQNNNNFVCFTVVKDSK